MIYKKKNGWKGEDPYASKDNYKPNNTTTITTTTVPNIEYAYHKGMSFAKEKEEKEILCPEVV